MFRLYARRRPSFGRRVATFLKHPGGREGILSRRVRRKGRRGSTRFVPSSVWILSVNVVLPVPGGPQTPGEGVPHRSRSLRDLNMRRVTTLVPLGRRS